METHGLALDFVYLADRPDAIPLVAGWWFEQWGHEQPGATSEGFAEHVRAHVSRDRLPIQLLAVVDDSVVGVATLTPHELFDQFPDLHPWLGGVYVAPPSRGRGIASALAMKIVGVADALGLPTIHLQTEALDGGLYARLGWKPLHRLAHKGVERLVMARAASVATR